MRVRVAHWLGSGELVFPLFRFPRILFSVGLLPARQKRGSFLGDSYSGMAVAHRFMATNC